MTFLDQTMRELDKILPVKRGNIGQPDEWEQGNQLSVELKAFILSKLKELATGAMIEVRRAVASYVEGHDGPAAVCASEAATDSLLSYFKEQGLIE